MPLKPAMRPWLPEIPGTAVGQQVQLDQPESVPRRLRYLDHWLLSIILFVTFFIRVWQLDRVPVDIMPDEADYLNSLFRILRGIGPMFFEFAFEGSQTASNAYIQAAFVKLFGLENAVLGIRMSAAVMSTLSVIPFFFLIRGAFGRWTALFTTILFSSSWWYLNLSRTAWINTFVVLYALMAIWLLELALRASRRRALLLYALAGVFASLILYGYVAGKALVLALGVYLLLRWVIALFGKWRALRITATVVEEIVVDQDTTAPGNLTQPRWRPAPSRPSSVLVGSIVLGVVMIAVFLPQVPAILNNWNGYIDRPRAVSITNVQLPYEGASTWPEVYQRQISKTFDGFVLMRGLEILAPGVQVRYNPPSEPFIDPVARALYMVGIILSLFMLGRSLPWLLMWLSGLVLTQVLTVGIPDGARAVVVIPSVYFFVACSIYWIMRGVEALANRLNRLVVSRTALALAALVCAGLSVYNVRHYWDWMHMPVTAGARQPSVEFDEFEEWQYHQFQTNSLSSYGFTVDQWHVMRLEQPQGLVVSYHQSLQKKSPPDWLRRGAPIALVEDSPIGGPQAFMVQWTGFLIAPQDGTYEFSCVSDGYCELVLDGQMVLSSVKGANARARVTGTARLTQGPHRVAVQYKHHDPDRGPVFTFEWRIPDDTHGTVPLNMLSPSKFTLGLQGP